MYERRNKIRTKLIVTFILLVTAIVVAGAMVWYRVATSHVRREMENRLLGAATAASLLLDPVVTAALVHDPEGFPRTRGAVEENLRTIQQRLGVREVYVFDRERRILATTDTLEMQVGQVAPELANYASEIERVFGGQKVVTVPFQDDEGNVYQSALVPVMGFIDPVQRREMVVAALGVDLSVGFLDVFHDFRRLTVVLTLVGIVLTVGVGFVFARTLSRPIASLVSSAERMERGEMTAPVEIDARDEIGYLGHALENMRRGILRRDRHLRTMLAGVAHEIRNPLGGIEIFAGLLRDELDETDRRRSHLDKIIREVQHLKTIINEFLIYARPRTPVLEPFPLREAIDDVRFLLAADCESRRLDLVVHFAEPDITVHADGEQVKRALLNLIKNAIQASLPGGQVGIRAQRMGDRVRIAVEDYGPGIHPEHLKQIFDPFFTTKGAGAGLGLSIVKSIIEENDGEIWVESIPGEKTVFFVALPAAAGGERGFRAATTPATAARS